MADMLQSNTLKEFRRIPGVGTAIAEDMWSVGLRSIDDLKNRDPQELYDAICTQQGTLVDRCMLYVMRCAGIVGDGLFGSIFSRNDQYLPRYLKRRSS